MLKNDTWGVKLVYLHPRSTDLNVSKQGCITTLDWQEYNKYW